MSGTGQHSIPIQKRIIKQYGPSHGHHDQDKEHGRLAENLDYEPFVIDQMPRTAFKVFHYNRKGFLERDSFYFHSVKGLRVVEGKNGVSLCFYADNRAIVLRGGVNMHAVAEAIEDCTLETVTVFHSGVWDKIPNDIEIINRISIDTLPVPGHQKFRSPDDDDFDDDELPGESPLS